VIPLRVELLGHLEDVLGAVLHAESASLASILEDANLAAWYVHLIQVQRFAPVFHWALRG
jgi:hypothetical protein